MRNIKNKKGKNKWRTVGEKKSKKKIKTVKDKKHKKPTHQIKGTSENQWSFHKWKWKFFINFYNKLKNKWNLKWVREKK
jgi:hypothetical protein